ncbi:unnamed protein product [Parnassius apollo]|uniref:(apollo) hypothetical protein n=1 Tax=Parnassius apollo TaxID=110799 RepID=A0A8S3XWW9_PARAO|nr:unnamed protein product [Parnassius apollo]
MIGRHIPYSSFDAWRFLENLDKPNDGPLPPTPDPPNSSALDIQPSVKCQPKTSSDRPRQVTRAQDLSNSSGAQQISRAELPLDNIHSDSPASLQFLPSDLHTG